MRSALLWRRQCDLPASLLFQGRLEWWQVCRLCLTLGVFAVIHRRADGPEPRLNRDVQAPHEASAVSISWLCAADSVPLSPPTSLCCFLWMFFSSRHESDF